MFNWNKNVYKVSINEATKPDYYVLMTLEMIVSVNYGSWVITLYSREVSFSSCIIYMFIAILGAVVSDNLLNWLDQMQGETLPIHKKHMVQSANTISTNKFIDNVDLYKVRKFNMYDRGGFHKKN